MNTEEIKQTLVAVVNMTDDKNIHEMCTWCISELNTVDATLEKLEHTNKLYKTDDYHEDYGDCMFFHFYNMEEAPDICIASTLDGDFDPKRWTHFARYNFNPLFQQYDKQAGS